MPDGSRNGIETRGVFCRIEYKGFEERGDMISITGIATTPRSDRVGDIVEPKGAQFKLPLPFMWQHRSHEPIGNVVDAKVTKDGITFRAEIPNPDRFEMGGTLRTRLVEALESMHAKLVGWTSIGFAPKEMEPVNPKEPWGAQRFLSWEWLELSAVTIPANSDAAIQTIKSMHAAATGKSVLRLSSPIPGASGSNESKGTAMKTYSEKLKSWTEKRADLAAARVALMEKAEKDGDRVLTAEENAEHDKLTGELKQVDDHIVRLKDLEAEVKATASAIDDESEQPGKKDKAAPGRDTPHILNIKARDEEPGMRFARYVKCHMLAKGNPMLAQQLAKTLYPSERGLHTVIDAEAKHGEAITKANILAATTTDATWAGALVQYQDMANEFLDWLRPQTIVGKFGANGVPGLTRVPFNARVRAQTSGGSAYWVGEGKPKPLTKFDFTNVTMATTKIAAIAVVTQETLRLAAPSADMLIRNALRGAVVERMDRDFIDPDFAGTANVSPASITYGAPTAAAAGALNANVTGDTGLAVDALLAALPDATMDGLVWMMSGRQAYRLSQAVNSLGQKQFNGISLRGGDLGGIPVITSEYLAYGGGLSPGSNNLMVLVHAPSIFLADDGEVSIDASDQASLQMLDNPTNDTVTPTATSLVSMYQTNSVAIRAERFVNWKRARDGSVYVITGAAYTGLPS